MNDSQVITPGSVSSTDWLAELDEQYKHWKQVEHVAVWGGSFEREHGARMEIKGLANKMFDTLLKLLAERSSANEKLNDGCGNAATKTERAD